MLPLVISSGVGGAATNRSIGVAGGGRADAVSAADAAGGGRCFIRCSEDVQDSTGVQKKIGNGIPPGGPHAAEAGGGAVEEVPVIDCIRMDAAAGVGEGDAA